MRDWNRQVVITGMGVCCHLGDDLAVICKALRHGEQHPFEVWPPAVRYGAGCQVVGLYRGDVSDGALAISKKRGRFMGRAARLGLKAARIALAQAGIEARDLGVVVGSGTGDVDTHVMIQQRLETSRQCRRVGPTTIPKIMASTVSANLVNVLGCRGPSVSAAAACAGGAYNLLLAAQLIEAGHMDGAIAGGVEATDMHFHAGFDAMRAYNRQDNDHPERASRPYAADRAGFIFGEGAGVMVLESRESAERRGALVLGVIGGYGMSSDGAGEMVAPSEDGALRALNKALAHAQLGAEEIDYVNTHGTSTPLGDVTEISALRRCFGGRRVRYSSTKGYTGHTISAAGAIEGIFTVEMLRGGWVAPSLNAQPLDPLLEDYPPVLVPQDVPLRHALSNSFGFGGTNATVVYRRAPR